MPRASKKENCPGFGTWDRDSGHGNSEFGTGVTRIGDMGFGTWVEGREGGGEAGGLHKLT